MSVIEEKFSAKFDEAVSQPKNRGAYYKEDAAEKGMALVEAKFKDMKLYWLVDVVEDRVYSAKFFAYGGKVSVGICETLCTLVKGLTLDEACSLLGADVERTLRDDPELPAVPEAKKTAFGNVPELLKMIKESYPEAKAVAMASNNLIESGATKPKSAKELTMQDQAWLGLTEEDQIKQIDIVLDEKVRPGLMQDGGNIQVMEVVDGERVIVQYQGACGSCGSSLGATLSFIERALRDDVYNDLQVIPNM